MFPDQNYPGLSSKEATLRQQQFGPNSLPEQKPPSHLSLILAQIRNPLIYILLLAGIATLTIGDLADAVIILLAVALNTVLGFIQERKASDALHALKHYVTSQVTVLRDHQRVYLETSQIVPGDVLILGQGHKVPADGQLVFANRLFIDESLLTGESVAIKKLSGDTIYMGTTITLGQAVMIVSQIGTSTKMGAIAVQIQKPEEDTPLQKQLNGLSRQLLTVVMVLVCLVFLAGLYHQYTLFEMFTTSVALAVSSIPEGLMVSLTVVLAIGMQRILKRRGLTRKLTAAETLGGVTVICIDKTGTLTQGQMKVVDCLGNQEKIAEQVLLANDLDDPIIVAAFEWGQSILKNFNSLHQRLDSIPFSSKERFFISLHRWSKDHHRIFVNGAPDVLLPWTNLSPKEIERVISAIDDLTSHGKRVIGLAQKDVSSQQTTLVPADARTHLTWVGLLAFSDPVRESAKSALEQASAAGIRTLVITGDYAKNSEYVMSELGLQLTSDEILTGDELATLSVHELSQKVGTIRLFARTTPEQKLKIVEALKNQGEVVAMMGDGVNDAPALHAASIGIAVGEATDVAKESADLILLDSNFSTIIGAIEEGRLMFENIRKIILYLLCDAFEEIIVVLGCLMIGLPLPVTAVQILWINLVSDGLPDLALTVDNQRKGLMLEKPRVASEGLVNAWMAKLIGLVSLVSGLIALTTFIVVYRLTSDLTTARSLTFVVLGLNSLVYVFSVRSLMSPFWENHLFDNRWLVVAVLGGIVLQALPFVSSGSRHFFGLADLSLSYWLLAGGLAITMFFVIEIFKYFYQSRLKIKAA